MNSSTANLLDLPDEMLIKIFNKLSNADVLNAILGANRQLDRLARDANFTQSLDLTAEVSYNERCSISNDVLDRFCSYILPQIHDKINSLLVEPSSMQRILCACAFPSLHQLTLSSIESKDFIEYLSDNSSVLHIFKQITHLNISTIEYYNDKSQMNLNTNMYTRLFSVCQRLTHLTIKGKHLRYCSLVPAYALPLTMCSSSTIVKLDVNVRTIDDCLRLLDGRFNQMKILNVKIDSIDTPLLNIDSQYILPNLTTFFLSTSNPTKQYDNVIVPLLRRMTNLKTLVLVLMVENRPNFIDGAHLHQEVLIHMPRLKIFLFNITTIDDVVEINYWLKEDDIEETMVFNDGLPYFQCRIDIFKNGIGRCRFCSMPFMKSFRLYY
ncbi:unnamed protein product [Rotaria socialis]|uniref:F-box domain-containing protein n=1 Tax=Rotaria socialis TaxID=392032 RepID=A0A817QBB4_9BILA|nr:unnamed protein product [Rotaria socialis]CAF3305488.1 unnamed protein product [Rotaria socialis]CAF4337282.1 unnamed protein product [Rotaria socialis]CAF4401530.1 unnamed protein product [Rotaria socialis]